MKCLYCHREFKKKHPSQKFCGKVKGRHICKDKYHNRKKILNKPFYDDTHPFSEDAFN